MLLPIASLALALVGQQSPEALKDGTIAGSSLTYLDTWTATQSGHSPNGCDFKNDTDLQAAGKKYSGRMVMAADASMCCTRCWEEATCAASVFVPGNHQCWLKNSTDIAGGSYKHVGVTACMRKYGAPVVPLRIAASVPGDLLTDLQKAGQIGDPLYEKNWLNNSLWHSYNWTYSSSFNLSHAALDQLSSAGGSMRLVFEGIKMGARISVNGIDVGIATDQFLRYSFDLVAHIHNLRAAPLINTVDVVFDPTIPVDGRFMACTGGWDWAPYSHTTSQGAHTMSKGIWRPVYLLQTAASSASIEHIVPQITYKGEYPTEPLVDGAHAGFDVTVRVYFHAKAPTKGTLTVNASWPASADVGGAVVVHVPVSLPAGVSHRSVNATASAAAIKLWWPAGLGAQPLYQLNISFTPDGHSTKTGVDGGLSVSASRRVGFRYFALVSGNDTDPAFVQSAKTLEGSGTHGMYWRVNGAVIFSKGGARALVSTHCNPYPHCPSLHRTTHPQDRT